MSNLDGHEEENSAEAGGAEGGEDGEEMPSIRERVFRGLINASRQVFIWAEWAPGLGWVRIDKVTAKSIADTMHSEGVEEIVAWTEKGGRELYIDTGEWEDEGDDEGDVEGEEVEGEESEES